MLPTDLSVGGSLTVTDISASNITAENYIIKNTVTAMTTSYASGSSTSKLTFSLAIGAANAATNADDVLVFGANPLALNSGTIVDTAEGGNATITSAASIGTAAGSITVTA